LSHGAEWHTEVLEPLARMGAEWERAVATGGGDIPQGHPVGKAIARQNIADRRDTELMPEINSFRRSFIFQSFNRDAAIADDLGAAVQISALFEPKERRSGIAALMELRPSEQHGV
jgi:hypothetical protein